MTGVWHQRNPKLLDEVRQDVTEFCDTLLVHVEGDTVVIRGSFPVRASGEVLDEYAIEVRFPPDYPVGLPAVREVGGRIPWSAKFHAFTNGNTCVILPEERWWVFPPGTRFREYLEGPLHNYFLGQSVVAGGGSWPFGEHAHGWPAVIAFYGEKFGTNEPKAVIGLLSLLSEGRVRGHAQCPCGSGSRIRHCHPGAIAVAQKMPAWAARVSLDGITAWARDAKKPQTPASAVSEEKPIS